MFYIIDQNMKGKYPFFIAEIGINHNGDISLAKKLIEKSKPYGFDAVKFQKEQLTKLTQKKY